MIDRIKCFLGFHYWVYSVEDVRSYIGTDELKKLGKKIACGRIHCKW